MITSFADTANWEAGIDVVATRGADTLAIEVKGSLSRGYQGVRGDPSARTVTIDLCRPPPAPAAPTSAPPVRHPTTPSPPMATSIRHQGPGFGQWPPACSTRSITTPDRVSSGISP